MLLFGLSLVLGFFLTGYFWARMLELPLAWPAAFLLSHVMLFYTIFVVGVLGWAIIWANIVPWLVALVGLGWVGSRRVRVAGETAGEKQPWTRWDIGILSLCAVIMGLIAVRFVLEPLTGFDTTVRWDFLALQVLRLEHFQFYPPVQAEDFRHYFMADCLAPLVSFSYWWVYASLGVHVREWTVLLVLGQIAAVLAYTHGIGSTLFGRESGMLAVGILITAPLFGWSLGIGQENGWTALGMAAMIYYLIVGKAGDWRMTLVAGIAAGIAGLAREYGLLFTPLGLLILFWRDKRLSDAAVFLAAALAVAGPWYFRNWIVSGNPLYTYNLGIFPPNRVYVGYMASVNPILSATGWGWIAWLALATEVFVENGALVVLGLAGLFLLNKDANFMPVVVALIVFLYFWALGYSVGAEYALKLTSPALVVLAVTGGRLLHRGLQGSRYGVASFLLILVAGWGVLHAVIFPHAALTLPAHHWAPILRRPVSHARPETTLARHLNRIFPPGSRILTSNPYLHPVVLAEAPDIEVVSIYSPEVAYLFEELRDTPEKLIERLTAQKIYGWVIEPASLSGRFVLQQPPFRVLATWPEVLDMRDGSYLFANPQCPVGWRNDEKS